MGDSAPAAPRPVVRLAWYAAVALGTLALAGLGYRIDAHDLRVPLLYHDAKGLETDTNLILPMVKATIDRGSHWRTERLGAPGVQEMHDFPVIDHFHFALIWVMGRFDRDPCLVFNLYFLLGFPFAALTTTGVLRHFGPSFPAAAVGGVLYAFTPFHMQRGQNHFFLSAYYLVPLAVMVALWICRGRLPFFPEVAGRRRFCLTDRDTLFAVAVTAVTSAAGAYYAFFACIFLAASGLYGWAAARTWRAAVSGALVTGVVFAGGVVNHLPAIRYQAEYGRNAAVTERFSEEAEYYGLKLSQLVLPIDDHSLKFLAFAKAAYNSPDRPVQAWTERYSLGTFGTVGFLILLAHAVLPVARGWPYSPLAAFVAVGVLVGTVGGFGAVFNHLVSPQVRCYNRVAIFLAFFCLFALLHALDRAAGWLRARYGFWRGRVLPVLAFAAIGWFGMWDQTAFYWGGAKQAVRNAEQCERFAADKAFFAEIEEVLNPDRTQPGPMVFQLPYVRWPECPPVQQLWSYEHARGYLHTDTLRFSFGAMKWREADEWQRSAVALPVEQMLARLVRGGFAGLILDRRGYSPKDYDAVRRDLDRCLGGTRQVAHPDGKQLFFDLRPHRDWLRANFGRTWEADCEKELHPLTLLWLDGFVSFLEPGREWMHRWCGRSGLLVFVNPTDKPRHFRCGFHVRTTATEATRLTIDGGAVWTEALEIDGKTPLLIREFTIPPGRHAVRFRCEPPESFVPSDARKLFFFVAGLKAE